MKWIYWASTGLLSLMMLASAGMYLFNNEQISQVFTDLGFPTFIVVPLAFAKILGVLAITTRKVPALAEWAYAGFFYDFLLALGAHLSAGDGDFIAPIVALILLFASYLTAKKVRNPGPHIELTTDDTRTSPGQSNGRSRLQKKIAAARERSRVRGDFSGRWPAATATSLSLRSWHPWLPGRST